MSTSPTVVLNCAGIGSRLGLGKTKVLMEINGKTLLERHLSNFRHIRDLRIVVGFQSADVIAMARSIRNDILFVYNHDYFDTNSAFSFILGARHGSKEIIQWDGDLVIHPEDAAICLSSDSPFAAYSDKRSQDGVYCQVNQSGMVDGFSRDHGDYEWTGPCRLPMPENASQTEYVYNLLEPLLPIQGIFVRAMDIDTARDYQIATAMLKSWENS